jgi:hypothetical protein
MGLAGLASALAVVALAVATSPPSLAQRVGPPVAVAPKVTGAQASRPIPKAQAAQLAQARKAVRSRAPGQLRARTRAALQAISLPVYLDRMRQVWLAADSNQNWSLAWQGAAPAEPLPAAAAGCSIVTYDFVPAKKEKDPTKPGVWIDTPAAYVPNGWLSFAEVLAPMTVPTNQCEALGLEVKHACLKDGKKIYMGEGLGAGSNGSPFGALLPGYSSPFGKSIACQLNPTGESCLLPRFKANCDQAGGEYIAETVVNGCESYAQLGPDSVEAFLAVARANFIAEDHNDDGVVSPGENQFLCTP